MQSQGAGKELLGFGMDEEAEKESEVDDKQSHFGGTHGSKSPHKSLAIKGPPKVISETLEVANYQGNWVKDINVKQIVTSVAQLRAAKENSSIQSAAQLDTGSAADQLSQHHGIINSNS